MKLESNMQYRRRSRRSERAALGRSWPL